MAVLVVSLPGETEATGGLHHRVEGNQGVGTHVQRWQRLSRDGGVGAWCGVRNGGQKDPSTLLLLPGEHQEVNVSIHHSVPAGVDWNQGPQWVTRDLGGPDAKLE